jgi:hypothetical protein
MASFPDLTASQAFDVYVDSLPAYIDRGHINFMNVYQNHELLMRLWSGERSPERTGTIPTWHVTKPLATATQFQGPYTASTFTVEDGDKLAQAQWCYAQHNMETSVQEINGLNGDGAALIKLRDSRMGRMQNRFADDIEASMWAAPASASDTNHVYGFPYMFPAITGAQATIELATPSTSKFRGGNPYYSGGDQAATWCGIDRSTTANASFRSWNDVWPNSTGEWTDAAVTDLSNGMRQIDFRNPPNQTESVAKPFDLVLYMNLTSISQGEAKARKNNDTVDPIGGNRYDLARGYGCTLFRGFPMKWVSQLDTDTSNPIYFVNHQHIETPILKGDKFRMETPRPTPTYANLIRTLVFLTYSVAVLDPQKAGGRISYVAAA